jgi:GTP cyclohydrolase IA
VTVALKKSHLGLAGDVVSTPCLCNQAVETPLNGAERSLMRFAAAQKIGELFEVLGIDYLNDHNTRDTPTRVAKMYVEEIMRGRYTEPPTVTEFENVGHCDQLIVTGPIDVRSTCAHHLMPIYGSAYIGILPAADGNIIGLSKYDRIVDYFSARLQIQEELVKQIGAFIMERTKPRGLAVRISAVHMCKSQRGVRASHASRMVTTEFYGDMLTDKTTRSEFLQECALLDRSA